MLTISCYCCIIAAGSAGCHSCIRSCTNLASDLFGKIKVCKIQKHSSRRLNKGSLIAIARTGISTSAIVPDLPYNYWMFQISISLEPYFTSVTNKHIRDVLIRFRIGASNIRTNKLRYVAHKPGDLMCPLCNTAYEDEMHTLFYCKFLDDLRQKYIPRKYTVQPSNVTLRRIMQDKSCLYDLGKFSYH